jgi:hypothetical protein
MSTLRHRRIVAAFRENDDHLTTARLAEVGGFYWPREVRAMRKLGYVLIEEASGDWFLEGVPDDAERAIDSVPRDGGDLSADPRPVAASPVDGSLGAATLFDLPAPRATSPYDVVEAA